MSNEVLSDRWRVDYRIAPIVRGVMVGGRESMTAKEAVARSRPIMRQWFAEQGLEVEDAIVVAYRIDDAGQAKDVYEATP